MRVAAVVRSVLGVSEASVARGSVPGLGIFVGDVQLCQSHLVRVVLS